MSLFKPASNTQAFLKAGILGFAGSGKTHTASLIAIGLTLLVGEKSKAKPRPVMFLDTETGSDWVKPMFQEANIELLTSKTRSFSNLVPAIREAEKEGCVLLTDSITHFWTELTEAYANKKGRKNGRLEFQDWAVLKKEWRGFTDVFVNSSAHIILCGRAGFEYDYFEDEDGKKNLQKTGVKMKAETEMGYEPSLLVMMEREMDMSTMKNVRTATILKDRSRLIDGKSFKNPTFKDFAPHINFLNIGGQHIGVDTTANSEALFDNQGNTDWQLEKKAKEIKLEEIEAILVKYHPSTKAEDKQKKVALLEKAFGTPSWTAISDFHSSKLEDGYNIIKKSLEETQEDILQ
ncbi:MAG: AAA family ATPase [Candidatus Babeliales bacterium]